MWIDTLTHRQCVNLLSANTNCRLACAQDGQPYVVPVTYAFAENHLYGLSTPGKKIDWMRANPLVSVEVHVRDGGRGWRSVVIDGVFEELADTLDYEPDREFAWSLLSRHANWWEPSGLKPVGSIVDAAETHLFYRIRIEAMSGRAAIDAPLP